jgi:IclR family pca regulon transcriptional regulator
MAEMAGDALDDRGRGDFVQSLERGIAVIRAFGPDHSELGVADVARATGLTRAAARRFLHTLVRLGYARTDGKVFALRPKVLEIGYAYLSALGVPEIAHPHLEGLVAKVRKTAAVSVLDGGESVYIDRVATKRLVAASTISVGTRFPAHATAQGRVLLAGQSDEWLNGYLASVILRPLTAYTIVDRAALRAEILRVREQGWSFVDQELEDDLRSCAVGIHDRTGAVAAALSVTAHAAHDMDVADLLGCLRATASDIEQDLAWGIDGE